MAINYSLSARSNPSDMAAGKKIYPMAQYNNVMTLTEFARHISEHGSCYSRGTIQGVIAEMVDCLREQLLLGNRVQLGDMGTFSVTLTSKGSDTAEAFTPAIIQSVNPRWEKSPLFADLRKDATFQYVGTRKAQAEARRDEKQTIDGNGGSDDGDNVVTD